MSIFPVITKEKQRMYEKMYLDNEKFKKSFLETNLTVLFFNSMLRNILFHLAQIDNKFLDVLPTYIKLSSEGINDYLEKTCPKEVKEFCKTYIDNLMKEYNNFIVDLKKAKNEESSAN